MTLGDFNIKVGNETMSYVAGGFVLGDRNDLGDKLIARIS